MKILKIKKQNLKEIIKMVIKFLKEGKVIIYPTDTVYGLLSDATNKKAVEKLFKIKKRSLQKPIPIFVRDIKMAKKIAKIDKNQEKFLKKVWPGKVTIVLRSKTKTKLYGVNRKTIALRIPKYKLLNTLLKKINCPLAQTSANISGEPAASNIPKIINQFKNKKYNPDLIIDGGTLRNKPSKVIDLTANPPKILRK